MSRLTLSFSVYFHALKSEDDQEIVHDLAAALAGERPASEALLERIEQMRSSAEEMALMFNAEAEKTGDEGALAEAARWAHREHKSAMLLEKLQATID